ncbi:hypothetical protein Scep_011785 [Stephania cephalantha]|uniref:Uncharacterized protein n=1 Tax=Stephania cephalantha TaxID=152367 RepID=A0AAP0JG17_9MAGN
MSKEARENGEGVKEERGLAFTIKIPGSTVGWVISNFKRVTNTITNAKRRTLRFGEETLFIQRQQNAGGNAMKIWKDRKWVSTLLNSILPAWDECLGRELKSLLKVQGAPWQGCKRGAVGEGSSEKNMGQLGTKKGAPQFEIQIERNTIRCPECYVEGSESQKTKMQKENEGEEYILFGGESVGELERKRTGRCSLCYVEEEEESTLKGKKKGSVESAGEQEDSDADVGSCELLTLEESGVEEQHGQQVEEEEIWQVD